MYKPYFIELYFLDFINILSMNINFRKPKIYQMSKKLKKWAKP